MHEESFEVGRATAAAIVRAKRENRPIFAVGTTVVRALETAARMAEDAGLTDVIAACGGQTKLLLQPGERLRVVDGLLTNFHLPRSTLLALVGALIGVENLRTAYQHAVSSRYRFYSYGDAMLIRGCLGQAEIEASTARALATLDAAASPDAVPDAVATAAPPEAPLKVASRDSNNTET
ncbi:MAG: hypothetical protein NVS3B20_25290 [Polyangiales bacterium]